MNSALLLIEFLVALLGVGILLADLWVPAAARKTLAYVAATGLLLILTLHAGAFGPVDGTAFGGMFLVDPLANYFKSLFLVVGILVILISVRFADRLSGYGEFVALTLFALVGMLLTASANDFILMFVALELVTVTFFILVSFQRTRLGSVEAGVKYLIFGALAAAFMVFGIALHLRFGQHHELLRDRRQAGFPCGVSGLPDRVAPDLRGAGLQDLGSSVPDVDP